MTKKAIANEEAINVLKGNAAVEGSVKQSIDHAFTEFNEEVISGINTRVGEVKTEFTEYKEHVDSKLVEVDDLQLNFTSHAENKENPHEVTAEQVGTYTKDQIQNIITIEDIDNICKSNISSDENIDIVSMATQYWVEQHY